MVKNKCQQIQVVMDGALVARLILRRNIKTALCLTGKVLFFSISG
jgi:hypothetical protein